MLLGSVCLSCPSFPPVTSKALFIHLCTPLKHDFLSPCVTRVVRRRKPFVVHRAPITSFAPIRAVIHIARPTLPPRHSRPASSAPAVITTLWNHRPPASLATWKPPKVCAHPCINTRISPPTPSPVPSLALSAMKPWKPPTTSTSSTSSIQPLSASLASSTMKMWKPPIATNVPSPASTFVCHPLHLPSPHPLACVVRHETIEIAHREHVVRVIYPTPARPSLMTPEAPAYRGYKKVVTTFGVSLFTRE